MPLHQRPPSRFSKTATQHGKFHSFFYKDGGILKPWIVFVTLILTAIVPIALSIWGLVLTQDNSDNKEQIKKMSDLVMKSQNQIDYLQKIYVVSDSTNKSIQLLNGFPIKLTEFGKTLDALNFTIGDETKKLEQSYKSLNTNYDLLIAQQKDYLDKISNIVDLTNSQIKLLEKNNKIINAEFSRRPEVFIFGTKKKINDRYYLDRIYLNNSGSIECHVEFLKFEVLNDDFVCPDSIRKKMDVLDFQESKFYNLNVHDLQTRTINVGLPMMIEMKDACYFRSPKIRIHYTLTYKSNYENKTVKDSVFIP